MHNKFSIILLILFLITSVLSAQNEPDIWSTIGIQTKWRKFDISAKTELRSENYFEHIKRLTLEMEAAYSIVKPVKIGASYQLIDHYDEAYDDYQLRSRVSVFAQGRQKFGNFTFTLRETAQVTTKDDSDRLDSEGNIDTYKISPEWRWLNKLKVKYDIRNFPVTPSFSVETFYQLNNPDGNRFNKLRYTVSLGYNLNKNNQVECYGLINNKINVSNPDKSYVLGISYTYSF
jgi:hypothetical protein